MSLWRRRKNSQIDLVLSSSGVRAPAFIGGIHALVEKGYKIQRIAGASGGAVIAAGYALGKSVEELEEMALETPYDSFRDFHLLNLCSLSNPSIYSGHALDDYYKKIFGNAKLKDFVIDCKIIVVTIVGRKRIVLDKETYPELPVWKAVRMSSTIPFIFPYYELEGVPVTDGGLDIRTGDIFPEHERPVVVLRPRSDYSLKKAAQEVKTHKLFLWSYLMVVAEYLLDIADLQHLDAGEWAKTVVIPTFEIGSFNFGITKKEILKLIQYGYNAVSIAEHVPHKN